MGLTNFTADDFRKRDDMKISRSKRDRLSGPKPSTKPQIAPDANPEDVPSGTVPEIMTWVGDDLVRAQKALDVELKEDRPRKGLVNSLSEMLNDGADESKGDDIVDANTTSTGKAKNVPNAPSNEPADS